MPINNPGPSSSAVANTAPAPFAGTFAYAQLPLASQYPIGTSVYTPEQGVLYNNGTNWIVASASAQNSNLLPGGSMRVVDNLIAFDKIDLQQWSTIITNATITYDSTTTGEARKATCTATASTARAILATTVTLVAGRKYYFRCKVEGMVGSPSTIIWTNGISSISTATISSNGVVGLVFTADTTAATFRIGLNPGGAAGNLGDSVTVSEAAVGVLTASETAPSEYTPPSNPVSFNYANANTLVSSRVTDVVGTANSLSQSRTVLISGDSLTNNTLDFPEILRGIRTNSTTGLCDIGLVVNGIPGSQGSANIANLYAQIASLGSVYRVSDSVPTSTLVAPFNSNCNKPSVVVWEFCLNDIIIGGQTLAQLQATANSVISICANAGVRLVMFDCTPCYGNPQWTMNKELVRQQYNTWITSLIQTPKLRTFSIQKILGSATAYANFPYDTLQSAYDTSGDGQHVHPNTTGSTAVANALSEILI